MWPFSKREDPTPPMPPEYRSKGMSLAECYAAWESDIRDARKGEAERRAEAEYCREVSKAFGGHRL